MGATSTEKIVRWIEAATDSGERPAAEESIVRAGEYLEKTVQLSEEEACTCLAGIDFSFPVMIVRLPTSVYVQYEEENLSVWYTDTGLSPDQVRLLRGRQVRKLFVPLGTVPALKSTSRLITDSWKIGEVFRAVSPDVKTQVGQPSPGGGTQYLVYDPRHMRPIN